jgi:hypothetical protein
MYNHSGTTDFLKLASVFIFIGVAVWWLDGAIGKDYTVLVIFALVGVILFAGGAMFAHINQKQTLGAITKFNADDAQIDKFRMASFKAMAQGESAMQKAAAQLTVLDAKRVDQIAAQRAKALTDGIERQQQPSNSAWTWDDDEQPAQRGDASYQVWE